MARLCEQLGIRYLVGGSLASSLHGVPRATLDVDLVIEIGQDDVAPFVESLRGDFYLDEGAIRDANDRGTSFNLIDLESYFKADVFVARDDEPGRLQMERRHRYSLGDEPVHELVVASPEDVVAQKLYWFQLGDRVSERQWQDALGVCKSRPPASISSISDEYRPCSVLPSSSRWPHARPVWTCTGTRGVDYCAAATPRPDSTGATPATDSVCPRPFS